MVRTMMALSRRVKARMGVSRVGRSRWQGSVPSWPSWCRLRRRPADKSWSYFSSFISHRNRTKLYYDSVPSGSLPGIGSLTNEEIFWNGVGNYGPLSEGSYNYRIKGYDFYGNEVVAYKSAMVEEHMLSLVLSDIADKKKGISGRVNPFSVLSGLKVKYNVSGFTGGIYDYLELSIDTYWAEEGQEMYVNLLEPYTLPAGTQPFRIFYTTPKPIYSHSQGELIRIAYELTVTQEGQCVRDICGNIWDMDPDSEETIESKTVVRFGVNPRAMSNLSSNYDIETGNPILETPTTPNPDPIPRPDH